MVAEQDLQLRLRVLFAEELQDGLAVLSPALLALEADAGRDASGEVVQELFRTAHSLKGAAHAAAVPAAVEICDRLESAFAGIRDGEMMADAALITQLLAEVDALAALAGALGQPPDAVVGAATDDPVPIREEPPASSSPAAPPAPAPVGSPGSSLRVSAEAVHEVLRHAGEGLAAVHRLHDVVEHAVLATEQLDDVRVRTREAFRRSPAGRPPAALETALEEAVRSVAALARTAEASDRALRHTSRSVAAAAQRLRTQPFGEACSALDRVVRDVATSSGKAAELVVSGEDIDVDRHVVAALRDPLLHLVRNAVDHGLEPADVRVAAGKSPVGRVEVAARLEGSLLHVTVRDDGGGVDVARLREAAARRGIPLPSDEMELAFVPGLSTRTEVTAVSGRGVGLDAARDRLEQLGGSLAVVSAPGSGTQVQLTTPVTLAVLRVVLVRAGQQVVALPTATVERVTQVERQELREVDGAAVLTLDRRSFRAVSLAEGLAFAGGPAGGDPRERMGLVLPRGSEVVLVTDGLLDELEVAVQPVPERLSGASGVLGIGGTHDGMPVIVINPVAVGRSAPALSAPRTPPAAVAPARILLAEDTVTTRALERSILEAAGYSVAVAVDGADAWEQLQRDGADLVVSDVDMPRMSGIELCRKIRGSATLRDLPVVLVTSLDSTTARQRGMEAGADAYVVKAELQHGTLLETVARLL